MVAVQDAAALLHEALAAHQAGLLDLAEARYREVLRQAPQQPDAQHLLGVIALQQGRLAEADVAIRAALALAPEQATFWNNLGAVARAAGRFADAAVSFEQAVALAPTYAEAWANLATVRQALADDAGEALALAQFTTLQPDQAQAWGRRGVLAYQSGQLDEAAMLLERSVALAPDDADAWSNLGAVQLTVGRLPEAEASQRRALAIRPDFSGAMNNLGSVLVTQSRWQEAADILSRVVAITPDDANCWTNLGHALRGLNRYEEAADAFRRALTLGPATSAALVGLGDCLQSLRRFEDAVALYERALTLRPDDADTFDHFGVVLQHLGRVPDAITAFRRSLALAPDQPRVHSSLIFVLDLERGADQEERTRWNDRFGRPTRRAPATFPNLPDPDRRLRIGYVSADFCHHSVASALLPILRAHDRAQVEVVCYSGVRVPDGVTDRFRALADVWHDVADHSDDALGALIQADGIDLLIDLSGHSGGNRLPVFVREPAPVQITAWGYATGTGLSAMHYFLADPVIVPPEARRSYAEEVIDLPSLLCYEPARYAPPVAPLPAAGRGYVTFGAFNRRTKITAEAVATWGRILAALPTARLIAKCVGLDRPAPRDWLLAGLEAQGARADQVSVLGGTPHPEHLAAHGEIDLMLDTFPQGGGITTLDSLLMGVPVVTLLGQRVPGRTSASFLTTLGLTHLVAPTVEEYVQVAIRAAGNLDRLAHERATLRERLLTSPIGDAQRYTRAVEATYRSLWRRWCDARAQAGT